MSQKAPRKEGGTSPRLHARFQYTRSVRRNRARQVVHTRPASIASRLGRGGDRVGGGGSGGGTVYGAAVAFDLADGPEGVDMGGGHDPGQHPINRREFMHMEVQNPQGHQQAEGDQEHACQRSQGTRQPLEFRTDVDGHVDLVGPW